MISKDFQGKENQTIPEMSNEYINGVSERYIELYEKITGLEFVKEKVNQINKRIETNILNYFNL